MLTVVSPEDVWIVVEVFEEGNSLLLGDVAWKFVWCFSCPAAAWWAWKSTIDLGILPPAVFDWSDPDLFDGGSLVEHEPIEDLSLRDCMAVDGNNLLLFLVIRENACL